MNASASFGLVVVIGPALEAGAKQEIARLEAIPAAGPAMPERARASVVHLRCSDIEAMVFERLGWRS